MNSRLSQINVCLLVVVCCMLAGIASDCRAQDPSRALVDKGMSRFRDGKISESISQFESAEKADPTLSPYLWQLGISRYYASQYELGRKQFELHRRVNPNDVENATWHFICVARGKSLKVARESLIPIDTKKDTRVPMAEVYEFYAGRATHKDVLKAANAVKEPKRITAIMYAHLYLGLYYEAAKQPLLAKKHMMLSAGCKLPGHYMHEVAKVHVKLRGWDKSTDTSTKSSDTSKSLDSK